MPFDAAAICSIFAMMPAFAFRDAARLFIFFALMPIAAIFLLSFDDLPLRRCRYAVYYGRRFLSVAS